MDYPKKLYKGDERLRVKDAEEEYTALKDNWYDVEIHLSIVRGEISKFTPHDGDRIEEKVVEKPKRRRAKRTIKKKD